MRVGGSVISEWVRGLAIASVLGVVAAGCASGQIESVAGNRSAPEAEVVEEAASSPTETSTSSPTETSTIDAAEAGAVPEAIEQTTSVPPRTTEVPPAADEEVIKNDSTEPSVRGDLAWETQAQLFFFDGIGPREVQRLWDGYPFAIEERSARIAAFGEDFSWLQDGQVFLELNQYFAFGEPSEFFEPIITLHSETQVGQSAVFVGTWDGETLGLGRIPALDEELTVIAADEVSVTIEGVGTEGAPAAFYFAQPLEVVADRDAFTTTITLPDGYVPNDPITVVFPTPELAAAGIIRSP